MLFAILLTFNLFLPNGDMYAQIGTNLGTMWNFEPMQTTTQSDYYGNVTFTNFKYLPNPDNKTDYASALERGGDLLDPLFPKIFVGGHTLTQELAFVNLAPSVPFPSLFVPVSNINSPVPIVNSPITGKMAVGLYWGIQNVMKINTILYKWRGIDKLGTIPIEAYLNTDMAPDILGYYHPDPNPLKQYFCFRVENGQAYISPDLIAHELMHAVFPFSNYVAGLSSESKEVEEGVCDVMGLVAQNYYLREKNPFSPVTWTMFGDKVTGMSIDNLKAKGYPTTYKGVNYTPPGVNPHNNAAVILSWLHKVSAGKSGFIDEDITNPLDNYYSVQPLDPDPFTAMKMASKLLFANATTNQYASQMRDLRSLAVATISPSLDGYVFGSPPFISMWDAWYAVKVFPQDFGTGGGGGVSTPQFPTSDAVITAESQYNNNGILDNKVSFHSQNLAGFLDLSTFNMPDVHTVIPQLKSSSTNLLPEVSTAYIESDGRIKEALDADNNGVFELYNNIARSKAAVSVQWASEETAKYLSSKYNYSGVDGKGLAIHSYIDEGGYTGTLFPGTNFDLKDFSFHFTLDPNSNPLVSTDLVAGGIAYAAACHKLEPLPQSEAASICAALGDMIGLGVKTKIKVGQGTFAEWTIGEDLFQGGNPDFLRSFSDPKSKKQPTYYQSKGYDELAADPNQNAGLLNFWYYLISVGGSGHLDQDDSKPMYAVAGIGAEEAEQIVWEAVMKLGQPGMDFKQFKNTVLDLIDTKYGPGSQAEQSAKDAFYAVGLGDSPDAALVSMPKNGATDENPWTAYLSATLTPTYVGFATRWAMDITTDPSFKDQSASTFKTLDITQADAGGLTVSAKAILQPNTTYYWRVRATEFANCHMDPVSCLSIQKRLAAGHDVRSFTTDGREMTASTAKDQVYPWGAQFKWATLTDPNNPFDPANPTGPVENYHIVLSQGVTKDDGTTGLKELIDQEIKPELNISVQTNPDQGPEALILKPNTQYFYKIYASGHKDIFGNEKNEGVHSQLMPFKTTIPNLASLMLKDIYPFYPAPMLLGFNTNECPNAASYRVEVFGKPDMTDPIFNDVMQAKAGEPENLAYNVDMKVFNPRVLKPAKEPVYYQIIPQGPPLTGVKEPATNEGVMNHGDLYDLGALWYSTQAIPKEPVAHNQANSDDSGNAAYFHFQPTVTPTAEYTYDVEIATPDFSSESNIIRHKNVSITPSNSASLSYKCSLPVLPALTPHEWRVTEIRNGVIGKASEIQQFQFSPLPVTIVQPNGTGIEPVNTPIEWTCPVSLGNFNVIITDSENGDALVKTWSVITNNPALNTFASNCPVTLQEGHNYEVIAVPLDMNGNQLNGLGGWAAFSTKTAERTITLNWDCGPNTPITTQTGQYILESIIRVSTGQPAGVEIYVIGDYDGGYEVDDPFYKPINEVDLWGNPYVEGWVLKGDLPSGDYQIKMKTKGTSACTTVFNIGVDGTFLPQHPAANPTYYQVATFTVHIP